MGSMIAGATSLTIATHYAATGEMPNFTDPYDRDWGKAKIPGRDSYTSFYGPFHSIFRTMARVGVSVEQGEKGQAAVAVYRFLKSKGSLTVHGIETLAELAVIGRSYTYDGELIEPNLQGLVTWAKEQGPIGLTQAKKALEAGKPEGLLGLAGFNIDLMEPYGRQRRQPRQPRQPRQQRMPRR
jgi:hypothetical protein